MAARRALIPAADLRRLARIARDEGVALDCRLDPAGGFSFTVSPVSTPIPAAGGDDLDLRLAEFARR